MPGYLPKPPSPRLNVAHPLSNGLIFSIPINEGTNTANIHDLSGNEASGTQQGTIAWEGSPYGHSLRLDGSSGYIDFGDVDKVDVQKVSFLVLVKINSLATSKVFIAKDETGQRQFLIQTDPASSDEIDAIVFSSNGNFRRRRTNNANLTTGIYYNIIVTWDGGVSYPKVYVNGVLKTGANSGSGIDMDMTTAKLLIGESEIVSKLISANFAAVTIWDRVLSQNEISQLHHDPFCMYRFPNIFSIYPLGFPLTDNVYHAARHILTTYDKLPSSEINFNNLQAERGYWKVGRQVEKRKRSNEYLRELARQSFIGIYPTRKGKRGLKAWREDRTIVATHDESKIEKILKFEKTPISKVYNDFTINFDHNPGRDKFNKSLFITKTDNLGNAGFPAELASTGADIAFALPGICTSVRLLLNTYGFAVFVSDPSSWAALGGSVSFDDGTGNRFLFGTIKAIDASSKTVYFSIVNTFSMPIQTFTTGTFYSNGTAIQKWKTYVGGLNDYATGKAWWTICNESYDRTLTVNPLPRELGDCFWFPDNEDFGAGSGGSNNAAFYLLQHFVEWTTRQKYVTEYVLPINAANIQLELFDPINFNDQKYTNNVNLIGWITKIKIVPNEKKPRMIVELMLEPIDIITDDLIIETGIAADTITESGTQTDTITEGAQ